MLINVIENRYFQCNKTRSFQYTHVYFRRLFNRETVTKTRFEGKLMQFVSLPEQFTPNRPSKHWHCPSIPQVPWPLHVVLGLQNSKTNERKVSKSTFKSENDENLITN